MNRTLATPLIATTLALAATLAFGPVARAATDEERAAAKQKWESMTPEEKAAAKEKAKAKWDAMTPEQQAEAKKKHPRMAHEMEKQKQGTAAPSN